MKAGWHEQPGSRRAEKEYPLDELDCSDCERPVGLVTVSMENNYGAEWEEARFVAFWVDEGGLMVCEDCM